MPKLKPSELDMACEIVTRNICAQGDINGCTTVQQKAARIGIAPATFSSRKQNPRMWRLEEIVRASIAFKCSIAWLVTDHKGEYKDKP